jgi:hypothetical protein
LTSDNKVPYHEGIIKVWITSSEPNNAILKGFEIKQTNQYEKDLSDY